MTIGPATLNGIIAAVFATFVWWFAGRLGLPAWIGMFGFGLVLVVVVLAGPLVTLP